LEHDHFEHPRYSRITRGWSSRKEAAYLQQTASSAVTGSWQQAPGRYRNLLKTKKIHLALSVHTYRLITARTRTQIWYCTGRVSTPVYFFQKAETGRKVCKSLKIGTAYQTRTRWQMSLQRLVVPFAVNVSKDLRKRAATRGKAK